MLKLKKQMILQRKGGHKMIKQKAYPGSLYDLRGVEKWLEDLSAHGLRLEEFSNLGKLAKLEVAPPARRRYYLEPDFSQYRTADEETDSPGEGWEFVCKEPGMFLVYASEDPWAQKPQRRQADEKHLRKKWRNLWIELIVWMVSLGLASWQVIEHIGVFERYNASYYELLTGAWLLVIPAAVTFLVEFWVGFTKGYDLRIWRRCVRRGEDAESWQGMKVFRWVEYCIIPIALLAIFLVFIAGMGVTKRTYIPIWRQDRVLPMVTLDVTEEEIYLAPEPYGPSIDVSFKRRLAIPQDIHINSYGLYENTGDLDAWIEQEIDLLHMDAELRFAYYRLWTKGMAAKLAESEAFHREVERVSHTDFDDLWFSGDRFGWEYLVAREGDTVITITYYGESALEPYIDEIYGIVMDYRNR